MPVTLINGPLMLKNTSLSNSVDCKLGEIIRIYVPPEWTYAPLSFLVSPDDVVPYANLCNPDGRWRILDVQANSMVLGGVTPGGFIKFRSGIPERPVPQLQACQFRIALLS